MANGKNGGTKAENIVKANGKGKAAKTLGKPASGHVELHGAYKAKFGTGDYAEGTKIRARADKPKLIAVGTYGKLKALIAKSLAEGKSLEEIGKGLGVSGARISEFCVIFGISRPKKAKAEKPKGKAKPKAKASKKVKPIDQGDEGDV